MRSPKHLRPTASNKKSGSAGALPLGQEQALTVYGFFLSGVVGGVLEGVPDDLPDVAGD